MQTHRYQDLIAIFDRCFAKTHRTRLIKGDSEPVYLPADEKSPWHQIIFAHGFYASALHEIAHWCIAGELRRKQIDYGYWYCPDGRDELTQHQFEKVEIKPQALEWIFSVAANVNFNVSCDALNSTCQPDHMAFQRAIQAQLIDYLKNGMPPRPTKFVQALQQFYLTPPLTACYFTTSLTTK